MSDRTEPNHFSKISNRTDFGLVGSVRNRTGPITDIYTALYVYLYGRQTEGAKKNRSIVHRERERTKYSSYFRWEIYFKKFLLGTWKYVFEKIWYSCSVFWALSNDVIFINSARSWKFRTSWYDFVSYRRHCLRLPLFSNQNSA